MGIEVKYWHEDDTEFGGKCPVIDSVSTVMSTQRGLYKWKFGSVHSLAKHLDKMWKERQSIKGEHSIVKRSYQLRCQLEMLDRDLSAAAAANFMIPKPATSL